MNFFYLLHSISYNDYQWKIRYNKKGMFKGKFRLKEVGCMCKKMQVLMAVLFFSVSWLLAGCGSSSGGSSSASNNTSQTQAKDEKPTNPYDAYKNGDKGIVGYMYWYTIEKMPKIPQDLTARGLLPHDGLVSDEELKEIKFQKASREKRASLMFQEAYEVDDKGSYLYDSNLVFATIAKVVDGKIVPVYIGQLDSGRYNGYGILFETKRFKVQGKDQYVTYVKYEGMFDMNAIGARNDLGGGGTGVLYEISFPDQNSSLPHITAYSGCFVEGKKHGNIIVYDGDKLVYEGEAKNR